MSRYKLFLGHLSPDARTRDVERFFKDHGFSKSIVEVVVKTGYGFVVSVLFIFEDILYLWLFKKVGRIPSFKNKSGNNYQKVQILCNRMKVLLLLRWRYILSKKLKEGPKITNFYLREIFPIDGEIYWKNE